MIGVGECSKGSLDPGFPQQRLYVDAGLRTNNRQQQARQYIEDPVNSKIEDGERVYCYIGHYESVKTPVTP